VTVALFVLTGLLAVVDWVAVVRGRHQIELIAKPLTLVSLIIAAGLSDLGPAKPWVLAALVFGLVGDIALMFAEHGAADALFMLGLGSFLLGHVAYLVAFTRHGLHVWQILAGALVAVGVAALVTPRVLRSARHTGGPALAAAVGGYGLALAAMTTLGFGTAAIATAIGALLFLFSDATLAWDRFVRPLLRGPVIVIVTYHLAQVLIVIGLIR